MNSSSTNFGSALEAKEYVELVADDPAKLSLQNGLDPVVEAALANIVEGLRHDW